MPVDYLQLQSQIKTMGEQAPRREQALAVKRQSALLLQAEYSEQIEQLRFRVGQALAANSRLRCALPGAESLMQVQLCPQEQSPQVLLAADGSQVNPDRHASVEFALVNVGVFKMFPKQALAPQEFIVSQLLYHDLLYSSDGLMTEQTVALMRDLSERQVLADMAAQANHPVVALTDGTLELFREPQESQVFLKLYREYITELRKLCGMGVITAGYVDRPRADLVVRLLELMMVSDEDLGKINNLRPLAGVRDADLFGNLLKPGDRSAVFAMQSVSSRDFDGLVALHFFYLNVGRPQGSYLARVEIPARVAQDNIALDLLHGTLMEQCRHLGNKPYPYALHRAHEIALVRMDDKQHIEEMIALELRNQGLDVGEKSFKQAHKDQSGQRTRCER